MKRLRALSVSERLAAMAGVGAAIASLAGFIPGVYRDPKIVITGRRDRVLEALLPAGLAAAGWPMNPPYVLDLGFVIPIAVLAAVRLLWRQVGGAWLAVSVLVFLPVLSLSVLLMTVFMAIDGQALQLPLVAVFGAVIAVSTALAWLALRNRPQPSPRGVRIAVS